MLIEKTVNLEILWTNFYPEDKCGDTHLYSLGIIPAKLLPDLKSYIKELEITTKKQENEVGISI